MPKSSKELPDGHNGVSRRSFIKGVGVGVVTTSVLPAAVTGCGDMRSPEEGVTEAAITLNRKRSVTARNGRKQSYSCKYIET